MSKIETYIESIQHTLDNILEEVDGLPEETRRSNPNRR